MRPEVTARLREAHDLYSLTKDVLGLCQPYGPVHSFRMVHNRGAARVVCFIEMESPKQQPALVRTLGAKVIDGAACLDIRVSEDFGAPYKVAAPSQTQSVHPSVATRSRPAAATQVNR